MNNTTLLFCDIIVTHHRLAVANESLKYEWSTMNTTNVDNENLDSVARIGFFNIQSEVDEETHSRVHVVFIPSPFNSLML